ncbi:MAG: signal recognition particle-docking protein FtsY [Bacteriovoracaceae bacterium]|nr:signal recognition particle-docking protein FtsY [Bacteriovoracaceae bacterium]
MIQILASLYNLLGIQATPNQGDLWGILAVASLLIVAVITLFTGKSKTEVEIISGPQSSDNKHAAKDTTLAPVIPFKDRLKLGLGQSRSEIWGKLGNLFSKGLNSDTIDEIEELLYGADIGSQMVQELIAAVEEKNSEATMKGDEFKEFLFHFLKAKMVAGQSKLNTSLYEFHPDAPRSLKTILIIGVNGAGKTTTIGKLSTKLKGMGAKVVVGACDTFRAAAVDQLQVWCDRAEVDMVRAKEGTNPTGVAYDALQLAINEQADYCILDTAGRLHTKDNLMEELAKTKRVLQKLDPDAPQETLLVLDAITGQNAMRQAEEFNKALGLTGLIFTKCDGSSKAGSAISISNNLELPISYIGVGESVEDLDRFEVDDYLRALLDL